MWLVKSFSDSVLTPTAIALGNFDGVHLGHQRVLSFLGTQTGLKGTVVTFDPHPQEFFSGQKRQLLTPLPEKIKQLEKLGIEQLILLPFGRELASISPEQFVETILVQKFQAKQISVGADFRFGHKRSGGAQDLRDLAAQFGVQVYVTALETCKTSEGVRISSSRIRQALAEGDINQANRMLGRSYSLVGTVIKGQQLGRTLGFPTANLQLSREKLLPRYGVYGVRVAQGDTQPPNLFGVMNIGTRPTVQGHAPTVEVHLLDWTGDLYGQTLTIALECFLRPEQKFPSLDALKAQINADCFQARKILTARM